MLRVAKIPTEMVVVLYSLTEAIIQTHSSRAALVPFIHCIPRELQNAYQIN